MITDNIPKSFWHSLSASVLIFTVGFTWITYKSGNLTLKYKDFEVITASAQKEIGDAKLALETKLKESADEIRDLQEGKENAEKALAEAKRKIDEIQTLVATRGVTAESVNQITAIKEQLKASEIASKPIRPPKPQDGDLHLADFKQVQMKLDNLGAIQKQIKEQAVIKY